MIIFLKKEKINKIENKIFTVLLFISILSMGIELLIVVTNSMSLISTIIQKLFLICIIVWLSIFMIYTFVVTIFDKNKQEEENIKKYKPLFGIFVFINTLLSIMILLLPITFNSIGSSKYTSGPSVNVVFITVGVYVLIMAILVVTHLKKINKKGYLPIVALIILLMLTAIIQKQWPGMLLSNAVFGIIIYLMYHTIENPDLKMLRQMGLAKTKLEHH
jgi:hypothetical protein